MSSRRERVRQATLDEIRLIARQLLVEQGAAAVTINAITRKMGMSGPAMYRYYASHEQLVAALVTDFYQELTTVMKQARDTHADQPVEQRILAICRAMRAWAIKHPEEFRWLFASPAVGLQDQPNMADAQQAGRAFGEVFLGEMVILWQGRGFPTSDINSIDPSLQVQLQAYCSELDNILPLQAMHTFLWCWIRLYGFLCMENMQQLAFAYTNTKPLFEECLQELCDRLGMPYTLTPDESERQWVLSSFPADESP